LQQAWQLTQQKYPSLRLHFDWEEQLIQIIDKEGRLDWRFTDVSQLATQDQETFIAQLQTEDRKEVFDLAAGSLFRIFLVKRAEQHYTLIFSNHHAILDGWSIPILLGAVHQAYGNAEAPTAEPQTTDRSYGAAQAYLQHHFSDNDTFWKDHISQLTDK